jgi:hypothetical protein
MSTEDRQRPVVLWGGWPKNWGSVLEKGKWYYLLKQGTPTYGPQLYFLTITAPKPRRNKRPPVITSGQTQIFEQISSYFKAKRLFFKQFWHN